MAQVELLFWEGCPSYPTALALLRSVLGDEFPVAVREVVTEEDAVAERFPGSPTIRVDGRDLFPIDWAIFGEPPAEKVRRPVMAGSRFR